MNTAKPASQAPSSGVDRILEQLFATHLSPAGRRYTLREVSAGTGLSLSYISMVRRGAIKTASGEHLQRLASFFGVDVACFLTPAAGATPEPHPVLDEELRRALTLPLVPDLARRVAQLPEAERARVLQRLGRGPADRRRRGDAV